MNFELELKRYIRQIRPGLIGATSNPNVNLAQVLNELRSSTQGRQQLANALRDFLLTRDFTTALTETGLTLETGLFSELWTRLEYKLLPKPVDSLDVLSFFRRLFESGDAAWLEEIDRSEFVELLTLVMPPHRELVEPLAPQFFMSLEILSLRLAGLGYDPVVTQRLRARPEFQHAFMDVVRGIHVVLDKGEAGLPELKDGLSRCSQAVRWIRSRRGVDGVSLGLTYRLFKIQQVVRRMELVVALIEACLGEWRPQPAGELFFEIIKAELSRFELRRFLGANLEMLAFQITEHTGRAGEHYITRTRAEWLWMFRSAAVGGAVVAGLAILKVLIAKIHLPLGTEAFAFGLLYASGFVLLHSFGATLATKQPAMTASHLASLLDEATDSRSALDKLAEIIVRTVRSQFVALLGNFCIALPVALLVSYPLFMFRLPLMSQEKAWTTLHSLDLTQSLSLWYAAVAGIGLFLSGLIAGAANNWFVFNNVAARLKHSDVLRRFVPSYNLDRVVHSIDHNLGFWVGNITLGFYLGLIPAVGAIVGLPLDIRHITFASAQAGVALASLNFDVPLKTAMVVLSSVILVGLINLAVSFSLTLFLVIKSRRIRFSLTPLLMRRLLRRLRERPLDYVIPPREAS